MVGIFISVEGPDGAGKSSLIKRLVEKLTEHTDQEIIQTREPGGSPIAEEIRELILDTHHTSMDARTEALLMAASRRQHLVEKILPAIADDKLVISDRFVDSSLAYQGMGREIGLEAVWTINEFAIESVRPDITLYLDVDASVGLGRIANKQSKREKDRLELEDIAFHNRVRQGYHTLIKENPDRFIIVDANQAAQAVFEDSWQALKLRLAELQN